MLNATIRFFLENKLVTVLFLVGMVLWGVITAPFDIAKGSLPDDPVAVDAIPDIGENQQIVFTKWMGRSPQDIEDQITYPLTSALLGIPGVRTVRSTSMFGFSSIYIIFQDDIEFYWSRSRILEKLNSLPGGLLPDGVQPALGPDATALGQIFWYTLEGRDKDGNVTGGWDLHELRTVQDFYVKYGLAAAEGVSEVASVGGFVKEYQIDIDPDALKANNITLAQVVKVVKNSNIDVGAKTIEINRVEYFVRGLGYIKNLQDLEETVVAAHNNTPIRLKDIARIQLGPANRRGALDKSGAEVVGGVVVARYGANPLEVINNVKAKIAEISDGLPTKTLADGTVSQVTLVPFYDRTQLIKETIGTLQEALTLEILITIIVVILMLLNLKASLLVSGLLPVAVLMCFIAMRYFGVDANIVALSGIAIAIGTMVDMGIVMTENILKRLDEAPPDSNTLEVVYQATTEVASAVITAVATTIISFLPVFTMIAAEGKLFKPLAFTKTFALLASIIVAIVVIPPFAHSLFSKKMDKQKWIVLFNLGLLFLGVFWKMVYASSLGTLVIVVALIGFLPILEKIFFLKKENSKTASPLDKIYQQLSKYLPFFKTSPFAKQKNTSKHISPQGETYPPISNSAEQKKHIKTYPPTRENISTHIHPYLSTLQNILYAGVITFLLTQQWLPLGVKNSLFTNFAFVIVIIGLLIGFFQLVIYYYPVLLRFCLRFRWLFLLLPIGLMVAGFKIYQQTGREFIPSLDEGAFLLMPTSMPHSGMEENVEILKMLDMAVTSIPEVETVVGKLGRVESPLDPAPISMYENVINYKSEYRTDENGNRLRYQVNHKGEYETDQNGELIPDPNGKYYRQWRDEIHSPDDIWQEIVKATKLPGVTSAPKLQPIETRLVMLQTGMRAPMGIKVKGGDLETIQAFGLELENALKKVEGVKQEAVFAERIVGKPYLKIDLKRAELARYGLTIQEVQHYLEVAIGGITLTQTVEGRERYPVRVRYPRALRDNPEAIQNILIPTPNGSEIPLSEVVELVYEQGPQAIKSEDSFLVGYVLFDRLKEYAEVDVVENAQQYLNEQITSGALKVPAGVSYRFAGNYENQVRANERLAIVMPLALAIIFLILYFQFRSVAISLMVFLGVFVAFSGGFIMLWLYGQTWFMDFSLFGINMRDLLQIHSVNLSVAVWVGFLALFGIATDDGVLVATYLKQSFKEHQPQTREELWEAVIEAGQRRVRPAMMTTATTILALLPVLTSTGRGSDIMIPMAIPSFGGMVIQMITMFTVPVLYSMWKEWKMKRYG